MFVYSAFTMFSRYLIPFVKNIGRIGRPIHTVSSISPGGQNQRRYVRYLQNRQLPLLICEGPPKTGKTWFACAMAVQELRSGHIKRIVITHPTTEPTHSRLIFDIFEDFYSGFDIHTMIEYGTIEISPLSHLTGRTLNNSLIISNDMQKSSPEQMYDLTTHLGHNSRMVITGNVKQIGVAPNNGLSDLILRVEKDHQSHRDVRIIKMDTGDIHSNQILSKIGDLYYTKPSKPLQNEHSPFSVFSKKRFRD